MNELLSNKDRSQRTSYMVQLDSLRAIAVLGVLAHHYLSPNFILNRLHWGPLGVILFFVLSGFLLTSILLKIRSSSEKNSAFSLRNFYFRRVLRLFPAYYLNILLTIIFARAIIRPSLVWHLTYTSNFYLYFFGWDAVTSHFWTLAVEMQFYLLWPLIIFFVPQKYLVKVIIVLILFSPLFRFLIVELGLDNGARGFILTGSCLDSLGIGALLALYRLDIFNKINRNIYKFIFCFNFPLFLIFSIFQFPITEYSISSALTYFCASVTFAYLVEQAANGFDGWMGKILETKLLVYLGKISYGVYIYHLLIPQILYRVFKRVGIPQPSSDISKFWLFTIATILLAMVSWHLLEQPINSLKSNFPYLKPANSIES